MTRPSRDARRIAASVPLVALALAAVGCGTDGSVASDGSAAGVEAPADEPRGDDARCLPEAVDCVDTIGGEEPVGDPIVSEDIDIVDALPPDTEAVEMAQDLDGEPFRIFLQSAVVEGDLVRVSFNGGQTPCFVVDHTETDEDAERVIVSVFVRVPDPSADCSQRTTSTQAVSVQLQAPLGDRALKDGSRTVVPGT